MRINRNGLWIGRLLGCLSIAGSAACSRGGSEAPVRRNVVLICLDTVRADHLGCYGYEANPTTPALDRLAGRSTVFLDTSSTAGWTKPSVPSFLTGTFPAAHGVYEGSSRDEAGARSDVLPEDARTLAEAFRERGYRTAALVRNAQLRHGQGIEQGFELYVEPAGDAREIRWRALDWLDARAPEEPFFLYLHFLDAHWPYPVPEEYARFFAKGSEVDRFRTDDWKLLRDRINDGEVSLSDDERSSLVGLYDGALRYLDDQLELLLRGLALRGLDESTVVCIVADHGEEFLEHGRIGHGHGLYENLLQVPWILHVPGREPARVDTPVSLVDLFPTLLGAAGLREENRTQGVDRLEQPDLQRETFAEHKSSGSFEQSVKSGEIKLLRRFEAREIAEARAESAPLDRLAALAGRFKVELSIDGSGALVATTIEPDEEDADHAVEFKGVLGSIEQGALTVDGIRMELAASFETYGETADAEGRPVELRPGCLVKAKVSGAGERPICTRLKLYAPDAEEEHELRGPLGAVVDEGGERSVRIGPFLVEVDERTVIDARLGAAPALSRESVLALLAGEARSRWDISRVLFDLAADPGELSPREADQRTQALESILERWGGAQTRLAFWSAVDQSLLSAEDLQALRAIGYAK